MNSQNWRNVNEKTNRDPMSMVMDIESGKIDQAQLMDQIIAHCKASYEEGHKDGSEGVVNAEHPGSVADNVVKLKPREAEAEHCMCGSAPTKKSDSAGHWRLECEAPMCVDGNPKTQTYPDKFDAIKNWNDGIPAPL